MSKGSELRFRLTPVVLGVLENQRSESALRKAFGDAFVPVAHAHELERYLRDQLVDLIVVSPWDGTGTRVAPGIASISVRYRPVLALYVDHRRAVLRELSSLLRAGVTEVILRDEDDTPSALRTLRHRCGIVAIASEALQLAASVAPPPFVPLLEHCFSEISGAGAHTPSTGNRRSLRTLSRLAKQLGLPGVRQTRSRCRLVTAIGLLLRTEETVERVALRLGYSSGAALHNLFKRHLSTTATRIAEHGDLRYWAERILVP